MKKEFKDYLEFFLTQEVEVEEIKEEKEFFDTSPREFNSFEEKVTYINKLFKGE